jgi:hypothetical protein
MKLPDLTGKTFGRCLVGSLSGRDKRGNLRYFCTCECGKTDWVRATSLLNGHSKSCGCIRIQSLAERSTIHGQAANGKNRSRTYLVWQSMVGRCHRPKDSSYRYYGAKGVTVCDRWRKFENFLRDMGDSPSFAHIHRIKNAKIYSKETCEWMSGSEHIALHNRERRKAA